MRIRIPELRSNENRKPKTDPRTPAIKGGRGIKYPRPTFSPSISRPKNFYGICLISELLIPVRGVRFLRGILLITSLKICGPVLGASVRTPDNFPETTIVTATQRLRAPPIRFLRDTELVHRCTDPAPTADSETGVGAGGRRGPRAIQRPDIGSLGTLRTAAMVRARLRYRGPAGRVPHLRSASKLLTNISVRVFHFAAKIDTSLFGCGDGAVRLRWQVALANGL